MLGSTLRFFFAHAEIVSAELLMLGLYLLGRFCAPWGRIMERSLATARILFRSPAVPRTCKVFLALAFIPIPGPFDEIMAGLACLILARLRPGLVRSVWRSTAAPAAAPAQPRIPAANGAVVVRLASGRCIPLRSLHSETGSARLLLLIPIGLTLLLGLGLYSEVSTVLDHISAALTSYNSAGA